MKRYVFKMGDAIFLHSPDAIYDDVEHRILNDKVRDIEFTILAENIESAMSKINDYLVEVAKYGLGGYPNLKNYKFTPALIKIIEIQ